MMPPTSDEQHGYHRPRRPNPDTLVYLKSLPLDAFAEDEVEMFLDQKDSAEFPAFLAAALAAIDEIKNEVASLAGDEDGAEILECLMRIAVPYSELAARILLRGTIGYCVHLAMHRYGSHVLQTLLQLAVASKSEQDVAAHTDAPPLSLDINLPDIESLFLAVCEELLPHAADLRVHLCGSHVIRTLVCVLAGVRMKELRTEVLRRGKRKSTRKKRKKAMHANDSGSDRATQLELDFEPRSRIDYTKMDATFQKFSDALSGTKVEAPGSLQQLTCHPSAGPLLIVLLRALTYADAPIEWRQRTNKNEILRPSDRFKKSLEPHFKEDSKAHLMAERIICWQRHSYEQPWAGDVIYGLAGEARGSHVLEAILKVCHDAFHKHIITTGGFDAADSLKEYVEHDVSNFVVQTLLCTVRDGLQAKHLLEAILPLISSGYVVDPKFNRRGILWRAVELSRRFKSFQDEIVQSIINALPVESAAASVSLILRLQEKSSADTFSIDAPGAHVVCQLLQFELDWAIKFLTGVCALSRDELELLAKDGVGSRCVWDTVIAGANSAPEFAAALTRLLEKMSGRWVALASDRVAHHVVINFFTTLPTMNDRKRLVQELSEGKSRLNGCAMGRTVADRCYLREYSLDGEQAWGKLVEKSVQQSLWMRDMLENSGGNTRPKKRKKNGCDGVTSKKANAVDKIMDTMKVPFKT